MPIRYAREGLRVVRIDTPDEAPQSASPPDPLAPQEDDYRVRLHRFAADVRGAVARYRLAARGVTPEQLRAARGLAGIGQRDLAAQLGIARSSIADAERRRRRVHPALAQWVRAVLREAGTQEPPK